MSKELKLLIIIFLIAALSGFVFKLYEITNWYDKLVHFYFGCVMTLTGYTFFKNNNGNEKIIFVILFSIGLTMFMAVNFEIIEFIIDKIFHSNHQNLETGVDDTMYDLIVTLVGSIMTIIINKSELKYKKTIN